MKAVTKRKATESANAAGAREALVNAAKVLFAKRGFDGVTVREIAEAAGVNFSLVRYHFGDKVGVYKACLAQYGNARYKSAVRILEPVKTTEEFKIRLKIIINEIIDSLLDEPDISRMMMREMESEEPLAEEIVKETLVKMAKTFVDFFTQAQAGGIVKKEINALFLTQIIQLTLSHIVLTDVARSRFFNQSIKNKAGKSMLIENIYELLIDGAIKK